MRGATDCARRLKTLFSSLRSKWGKVSPPTGGDPITQMILGVLSRDAPESKAREALESIRTMVVDYNELRVIPPIELAELVGDYPDARLKCEDISRALNRVFALNHTVSLAHLSGLSARDVRAYLDRIDGLEPYTRARIRLLGFQQHAIPLDEAMWAYARQEQIVDARCGLDDAIAFMERQIAPEDALEFVALLRRQAWTDFGAAVRRGEVPRIVSVPPDRTTRNMLQLVGLTGDEAALELEPPLEPEEILDESPVEVEPIDAGKHPTKKHDAGSSAKGARRETARPATSGKTTPHDKGARSASTDGKAKAKRPARPSSGKGAPTARSA
jgi:hypothetical protein